VSERSESKEMFKKASIFLTIKKRSIQLKPLLFSDMNFNTVENGNLVPPAELRQKFAYELWNDVNNEVLNGKTMLFKIIKGKRKAFELPPAPQILDFTTIKPSEDPEYIDIEITLVAMDAKKQITFTMALSYKP